MTWLLSADLHLSDRPKDAYRWSLFDWLSKMQAKHNVTATFLLGDLTENKDRHSATLVNRLVDELIGLRPPVYILRGNHDGIRPDNPYFRFLSTIEGVTFIIEPTVINGVAFIPHCPDQASFDRACGIITPKLKAAMLHACITGAIAENGGRLTGLAWPVAEANRPLWGVYAGDIHRPQRLANGITYLGAPYQVRFSDDFQPRVLLIEGGKERNLYFPAPHKWSLTVRDEDDILNNEDLRPGDQVKLTVELAREEAVEWGEHRRRVLGACKEVGLEVYGCEMKINTSQRRERIALKAAKSPEEVLASFCQAENVSAPIKKAGMGLLDVQR